MLNRLFPTALVLAAMLATSGCLIESTLDPDGGGTMTVKIRLAPNDTVERMRKEFESPNVTVVTATADDKKNFKIEFKYKDLTKLPSSKFFKNTTFVVKDDAQAGTKTVTATLKSTKPLKLPDDQLTYFGKDVTVSLTVPGEIVKSNATSTKDKTATWKKELNDVLTAAEMPFEVTFKAPPKTPGKAGTPATTPAAK